MLTVVIEQHCYDFCRALLCPAEHPRILPRDSKESQQPSSIHIAHVAKSRSSQA